MHQHATDPEVTRRKVLRLAGISATAVALPTPIMAGPTDNERLTGMGLVVYDCSLRRQWLRRQQPEVDLFKPLTFLRHCRSVGAGGMQVSLGVLDASDVRQLTEMAHQHDLFIDAIIRPPRDLQDLPRFEAEVRTARDVGVQAARTTIMPGRRYEQFQTLDEFRHYELLGRQMLELAAPIVEKHQVPLAVENHKDQRIGERVNLLKHLGCEFIGACVDTGNSFALLDGVYDAIEALAPYAFTVHLKDQALRQYDDGFLLGDIPLGQGSFDLERIVRILRQAKPQIRFALELITRDALKVPCLTNQFWATMPMVSGKDLARTLRFVRDHAVNELQQVGSLPLDQQVRLEGANVAASIEYAWSQLHL